MRVSRSAASESMRVLKCTILDVLNCCLCRGVRKLTEGVQTGKSGERGEDSPASLLGEQWRDEECVR